METRHDCMIEKKPGNWRVDKLRMILLYNKADFNLLDNKPGRDELRQVETFNQVAAK